MKFISKSTNLLIVLRPGLPAQVMTGTPAKPTISVRFKDGVAEVQQQELIDMMIGHPGFNSDFISADDALDPYASTRRSSEPAHVLTDLKYGTPGTRKVVGGDSAFINLPSEMQKTIKDIAAEMAKAMLPTMMEGALKELANARESNIAVSGGGNPVTGIVGLTKAGVPKKKAGRKPKAGLQSAPAPIAENSPQASVS